MWDGFQTVLLDQILKLDKYICLAQVGRNQHFLTFYLIKFSSWINISSFECLSEVGRNVGWIFKVKSILHFWHWILNEAICFEIDFQVVMNHSESPYKKGEIFDDAQQPTRDKQCKIVHVTKLLYSMLLWFANIMHAKDGFVQIFFEIVTIWLI